MKNMIKKDSGDLMHKLMESLAQLRDSGKKSIYRHVREHVAPGEPGLLPGGLELPDDDEYGQLGRVVYIPGASDVLGGSPGQVPLEKAGDMVDEIIGTLRRLSKKPSVDHILQLESLFSTRDTLSVIDPVLRRIVTTDDLDQGIIYQVCRHLFFHTRRRGVLKFCIAVMGLYGVSSDLVHFTTIARHPEFTLYGAVAVIFPGKCPECIWMEIASEVDGWGRIHLVNRLLDIKNPGVDRFLLTRGCRNSFLSSYSACSIARKIGLAKILKSRTIDQDAFSGAGMLLRGMILASGSDGPLEGIEHYPDASSACREFIRHGSGMARNLEDLMSVISVMKLAESPGDPPFPWDEKHRRYILSQGGKILKLEIWQEIIHNGVQSDEDATVDEAVETARSLKMDISEEIRRILKANPHREILWRHLILMTPSEGMLQLSEFATDLLSVDLSGCDDGSRGIICYRDPRDLCLETLARGLYSHPGIGGTLLGMALGSREYYTRMEAVRVLNNWKPSMAGGELADLVWKLRQDPDPDMQVAGENLIRKWSN